MKAARLRAFGEALALEEIPEPQLRPGGAIVKVRFAFVPPVMAELVGSAMAYVLPPLPFTPGMDAIAEVEAVADDVRGLEPGTPVYCDHFFRSHGAAAADDTCFIGNFGIGEHSAARLAEWPDGCYAQRALLPAECLIPLGDAAGLDAARLTRLGWLGTAYGAFRRAGLRPHQTVLVSGATGLLGTTAVLLALCLGSRRVVALGRRREVLDELQAIDPERVRTIGLDEQEDLDAAIKDATDGGSHVAFDSVGSSADARSTVAALKSLRRRGTAVLVGNSQANLPIPYHEILDLERSLIGSNWFTRQEIAEVIGLLGNGSFDLNRFRVRSFPLQDVNQAIAEADGKVRGFEHVALECSAPA